MNLDKKKNFFVIYLFLAALSLSAEQLELSIFAGNHYGEYIEETGQKTPSNIQGRSGGSRITYPEDFYTLGFGINYSFSQFEISGIYRTTPGTVLTGEGRDEDFTMDPTTSTARSSKISLLEGKFYDTAYTFTGTDNYADAKGEMYLTEYTLNLGVRYFFSGDHENNGGGFLAAGYHYTYSFFQFDDIVQYVNLPETGIRLYPIPGKTLTLSVNTHEYLFGGGYRLQYKKWYTEFSFQPLFVITDAHDSHYFRFMNFFINTFGSGFLMSLKYRYDIMDSIALGAEFFAHRAYQDGAVYARGGITEEDILSNFAGAGRIYMNNKESGFTFSITKKMFD